MQLRKIPLAPSAGAAPDCSLRVSVMGPVSVLRVERIAALISDQYTTLRLEDEGTAASWVSPGA